MTLGSLIFEGEGFWEVGGGKGNPILYPSLSTPPSKGDWVEKDVESFSPPLELSWLCDWLRPLEAGEMTVRQSRPQKTLCIFTISLGILLRASEKA